MPLIASGNSGRSRDDLEAQAKGPITNEHEMGEKPDVLVQELRAIPEYVTAFQQVFGGKPDEAVTFDNVAKAVAAFEPTLLSFNSKFDRYAGAMPRHSTTKNAAA